MTTFVLTRSLPLNSLAALLLCASLSACTAPDPSGDDDDSAGNTIPEFVEIVVRLVDFASGEDLEGATVTWGETEEVTDANGRARIELNSAIGMEFDVVADGYPATSLVGASGIANVTYTTFLLSDDVVDTALAAVGETWVDGDGTGLFVASLNTPAQQAVADASASLDATHGTEIIWVNGVPQAGAELIFEASPLVAFPGVAPGDVGATVDAPPGVVCLNFPALDAINDRSTFPVRQNTVTISNWICD